MISYLEITQLYGTPISVPPPQLPKDISITKIVICLVIGSAVVYGIYRLTHSTASSIDHTTE